MKLSIIIFILFFFIISFFTSIRFIFSTPKIEQFVVESLMEKHKIVFFGDSVLQADHTNSNTKRTLVEHLEGQLKTDILEVSSAAYNPSMYYHLLKTLIILNPKVETIIIPINLRAFSSSWINVPEYQFEQECSILSIIYLDPNFACIKDHILNLLFPERIVDKRKQFLNETIRSVGFLQTTKRRFFNENSCKFNREVYTCENKYDLNQAAVYLSAGLKASEIMIPMRLNYHYGESLENNNISLESLQKINEFSKFLDKRIIFYVTPHNMEYIQLYSGEIILNIMAENVNKISDILNSKNIYFIDFTQLLEKKHFDLECSCEHIDNQGKYKLASELSKFIMKVDIRTESK